MIIEFSKVVIKNFMSIGEASINLKDRGLTIVKGVNNYEPKLDSNGSGKSSIFESIIWALTGSTTRGLKNVTNRYVSEKLSFVELEFKLNGINYNIKRSELPKKQLIIQEENKDISGSTYTKSNDILKDKLGELTYDRLISIIILSQGLPGRFSDLSPSARKIRLESLSGTEDQLDKLVNQVDYYYNEVSDRLNEAALKAKRLEGVISSLVAANNRLLETINEELIEEAEIKSLDYDELNKLSKEYPSKLKILREQLLSITNRENFLRRSLLDIRTSINRRSLEVEQVKKLVCSYEKGVCPTCGSPLKNLSINLEEELDKLSRLLESLSSDKEDEGNISKILSDLDFESKRINSEITVLSELDKNNQNLMLKVSQVQSAISNLRKSIESNQSEIEKAENELSDINSSISSDQLFLSMVSYLKNNLTRKFRTYLVESVVQFMNEKLAQISSYLYKIQGTVSVKCNGNNIDIYLGDRELVSLSGGETRRVDLILQLAQRSLCEYYSGFSCNLLVLDEILDYLDTSGVDSVLSMMQSKTSDVDTIMVVTHRSDLSLANDDEIIVVKDNKQVSSICV